MPKTENQKMKTLYIAKYFMEYSDENHAITAGDIEDYLRDECGIEAERRSIYRDIAALRDVFDMDIDGGRGGRYRLLSRPFDFEDLKLLAECVYAAKFISASKAEELVKKTAIFAASFRQRNYRKKYSCFHQQFSQRRLPLAIYFLEDTKLIKYVIIILLKRYIFVFYVPNTLFLKRWR